MVEVDATRLRKALRLVYCIQKERGASCANYASRGVDKGELATIRVARAETDCAFRGFAIYDSVSEKTLCKVRSIIDAAEQKDGGSSTGFHLVLVCFNTLISSIMLDHILCHTSASRRSRDRKRIGPEDGTCSVGIPRVQSHQDVSKAKKMGHRRQVSDSDISVSYEQPLMHVDEISCENVECLKASFFDECTNEKERLDSLLNLLDLFVRLKESTGVQRAILSSILAVSESDSRLLLADLALEAENQRRHLENLSKLPPGRLYDLVVEMITMSSQLQQLQSLILNGVSLDDLRTQYDTEKLWRLLTVYIDKVHSLELLLVEEMEECCQPVSSGSSAGLDMGILCKTLGVNDANDLQSHISTMSPMQVKQYLLSVVSPQSSTIEEVDNRDSSKTVGEFLKEISNAPTPKDWEIDLYEINFVKRIGQGTAGTTYVAHWSGQEVAVKVASITEMGLDGWRTEVQSLQKLHHPNIIRLLGSVCHPNPLTFCLVLEYCNAGDLSTALQKVTPSNFFFHVAESIAKGMAYLHSRDVIHRDIKPANVLLDGNVPSGAFSVKVTDFGVATDSNRSGDRTAETGTYRWMAPEVIKHESYSKTADVYSFAVVLWQLLTREIPFSDLSQIEAANAVATSASRPPLPTGIPASIANLIVSCWSQDPCCRPSFSSILDTLQLIKADLSDTDKQWIQAPLGHKVYSVKKPKAAKKQICLNVDGLGEEIAPRKRKTGLRTLFSRKSSYF